MTREEIREAVRQGQAVLGLELGSTRIKAVLIGPDHAPIASGAWDWENSLKDGVWTYSMEEAWKGIWRPGMASPCAAWGPWGSPP